ncbi:Ornithine carbamoyltransferase [bacterium HR16]|nr:Ornithine carbamoyltransferase [bacterium HR16]
MVHWRRFTERARRVIYNAQEEAGRLGENYVGTEHLLLGLLRESDSTAVRMLQQLGVSLSQLRMEVERQISRGEARVGQETQLTPRAKRAIDLAYDEARHLNDNYIGTEHLLLGLIREGEGLAGRVLKQMGVDLDRTRAEVRKLKGEKEVSPAQVTISRTDVLRGLKGRDLLGINDLTSEECIALLQLAAEMKQTTRAGAEVVRWKRPHLLAMIFEKPSLRTRFTFEAAMVQLGGHAIYLSPNEIGLGKRESVADVARNLERWCQAIMARVFAHQTLVELAQNAQVPVINALSDLEHPCQALADFQTLIEHKGEAKGKHLVFVGDGNNVAHSLMLLAAKLGTHFTIACPEGYEPNERILSLAREIAAATGALITVMRDPKEAVRTADAIYTDVWASMGQEHEAEQRKQVFMPYQVNAELLKAAKPGAIVMHCLPAHRGEEITDEVIDGAQSVVFDQAENRLHAQKAVLAALIGDW